MNEIVGLDDSKLLRSDYVYDATQRKKQSEINTELENAKLKVKDVSLTLGNYTFGSNNFGYYKNITFSELIGSYTTVYSVTISYWTGMSKPVFICMDGTGTSLSLYNLASTTSVTGTMKVRIVYI
jgi:hypothetical protein